MAELKAAEVSAILKKQLAKFDSSLEVNETGTVLEVGDGIARVFGLTNAQYGELVSFESGLEGMVLNLEEDNVGIVLLGPSKELKEGDTVKRTQRIASVKVGEGIVGRVVNTLGSPIDGKGPLNGDLYEMPLERKAPGVIFRQPVNEPLQTGIKSIDAMIPIGRGQRELVIGDRQTGKTTVCIDTILNQKEFFDAGEPVYCIYVAVGQKASTVAGIARILEEKSESPHVFVEIFEERFKNMYPMEDPIEYLPERENSVTSCAQRDGKDPDEWLYDYFLGNNGNNLIYIPAANFSKNIEEMLTHPHTVSALGDGGAHVGSICDTSANIYVLTKWVKDQKKIELSEAIKMLTRQPAELYSLFDRGLIEEGLKADINVIDFEGLKLKTPHIVDDLPAGGRRFLQDAEGIEFTIKAGQIIYENGRSTGALPGKLLRGIQTDPRPKPIEL